MRKYAIFVLLITSLIGCASTSTPLYGNFNQNPATANDKKIADDTVKLLTTLYPPAATRFDFQHATPDYFGTYLVESMRASGYAVLEFKTAAATPSSGLQISYILDHAKDLDLYRVTIQINNQTLDRAYQLRDGALYAAGSWVRKE